jgi:hypothetical protein
MPDIKPTARSFRFWRRMTNVWTFVFFAAAVYDFFYTNVLVNDNVMLALAAIYAASLAIYSAEKEFRRWHHLHDSIHPGEFYAVVWTILIVGLIIGGIFDKSYHVPAEVAASYIAVISILAITRESKNFYKRKEKR